MERFATPAPIAIDNAYLHHQAADLAVARERLHMAHEAHDGVAQVLGYVNTKAQAAIRDLRREKTVHTQRHRNGASFVTSVAVPGPRSDIPLGLEKYSNLLIPGVQKLLPTFEMLSVRTLCR